MRDKRKFIRYLISDVQKEIMAKVDRMPATWDDVELRRFVSDAFERRNTLFRRNWIRSQGMSKRYAKYQHEIEINRLGESHDGPADNQGVERESRQGGHA